MHRITILCGLLLVFFLFSSWAEPENGVSPSSNEAQAQQYMIAGYSFTITGKTSENALRSRLIPNGDELFPSEEAMRDALDKKVQLLMNFRVFSKVEYELSYTNESRGIRFYQVRFVVVDASSILPFPYGKYDSNYGFRLGLKLYNRNVFGQLGNLYVAGNVSQRDNSFKQGLYYSEMSLSQVALGKQVKLDLSFKFSYDVKHPADMEYSYVTFKVNPQNMTIDHKALTLGTWFKIFPTGSTINSRWDFYSIGNELNWGPFGLALGGFSFYNKSIAYYPGSSQNHLYSLSYFRFHGLKISEHQIDSRVSVELDGSQGVLSYLNIGCTIGTGFDLWGWMNWYNDASIYNKMYPESPLLYELYFQWNSTLKRSGINWIGNFRKGMDFLIHGEGTWYPKRTFEGRPYKDADDNSFWLETMFSWFPILNSWFNPSLRITGVLSSVNKYFLPDYEDERLPDYIRGIRDDNAYVLDASDKINNSWSRAMVLNCNLTTKFITFGNFAHTYANPFVDVALVNDTNNLDGGTAKWLVGAGLEGIVILDRYPAYPIRASLGFNMEDVYKKIQGKLSGSVEYELYVGLYFFF